MFYSFWLNFNMNSWHYIPVDTKKHWFEHVCSNLSFWVLCNAPLSPQDNADFHYVDVWSSNFTWGGNPPVDGDFVVINQSVLLDTDTPRLKMILIHGGELIFDDKDITLQAENILVTGGGLFQVSHNDLWRSWKVVKFDLDIVKLHVWNGAQT